MRGRASGRSRAWRRRAIAGLLCWCALFPPVAAGGGSAPGPQEATAPPSAAASPAVTAPPTGTAPPSASAPPVPAAPAEAAAPQASSPPPTAAARAGPAADGAAEEARPGSDSPPQGPDHQPAPADPSWIESQRLTVQRGLGLLIDRFDRFFGDDRQLDLESPSTRLRLKSFGRTSQEREFTWGVALAVSVRLPRLERFLGNARLVLVGENAGTSGPAPTTGSTPPGGEPLPAPGAVGAPSPGRTGGRAELRFDVVRRGALVFDTGAGLTLDWPTIPFARFRAHVRLGLGAGLVLRATEELFVELGGLGAGTSTDLLVERFVGTSLRLRWEGHGIHAQHTRGIEWSTLVGAEWKAHRRTGVNGGVGAFGFGTPEPGMETWRTWIGVRQDLWNGWVFAELEPEVAWPRRAGEPRRQVAAVTLRVEVVLEGRPSVVGAANAGN